MLLPGLCSHRCFVCALHVPGAALRVGDPTGRQFRFNLATEEDLVTSGVVVGLLMWWAAAAMLSPDSTVVMC